VLSAQSHNNDDDDDERLKLLNIERLELHRIWYDLLWCYRIVFGLVQNFSHYASAEHEVILTNLLSILTVVQ